MLYMVFIFAMLVMFSISICWLRCCYPTTVRRSVKEHELSSLRHDALFWRTECLFLNYKKAGGHLGERANDWFRSPTFENMVTSTEEQEMIQQSACSFIINSLLVWIVTWGCHTWCVKDVIMTYKLPKKYQEHFDSKVASKPDTSDGKCDGSTKQEQMCRRNVAAWADSGEPGYVGDWIKSQFKQRCHPKEDYDYPGTGDCLYSDVLDMTTDFFNEHKEEDVEKSGPCGCCIPCCTAFGFVQAVLCLMEIIFTLSLYWCPAYDEYVPKGRPQAAV